MPFELNAVFRLQDRASAPLRRAIRSLENTGGAAERASNSLSKMSGVLGKTIVTSAAIAGTALAGFAVYSAKTFLEMEKGMNEVFTLLPGISAKAMKSMEEDVKAFSKEFGVLPDKVVPALYEALSAGVPKDNVFEFLEVAQKAAVGGVTDLKTAVDGLTGVINSYGADVITATEASDLMFTAMVLGKTIIGELSSSLYNVLPTAAALGVEFGDITAAMAAMTAQNVPTAQATTQMRQLLVELSKAGGQSAKIFEKISGKTFKKFVAEGGNVQDALKLMEKHAVSSNIGINDLFSSVEAGNAALALTGNGTEAFTNALNAMENSAGATEDAYNIMNTGVGAAIKKIMASVKVAAWNLATKFGPSAEAFADKIIEKMPEIEAMVERAFHSIGSAVNFVTDDVIPKAMAAWNWMKENSDAIIMGLGAMTGVILAGLVPAMTTLATTTWAAVAPLAPFIAAGVAIGVMVAGAIILWKKYGDTIKTFAVNAWNDIKAFFEPVGEWIDAIAEKWDRLTSAFTSFEMPEIGMPKWMGGDGVIQTKSHYHGLDSVPYEGYTARLHKSEMVLPRAEAESYRQGRGGGGSNPFTINIANMNIRQESDIEDVANRLAVLVLQAKDAGA